MLFPMAFRKKHSTNIATIELMNNKHTLGVFLDFAKAFDTVNHEILLRSTEET